MKRQTNTKWERNELLRMAKKRAKRVKMDTEKRQVGAYTEFWRKEVKIKIGTRKAGEQ